MNPLGRVTFPPQSSTKKNYIIRFIFAIKNSQNSGFDFDHCKLIFQNNVHLKN